MAGDHPDGIARASPRRRSSRCILSWDEFLYANTFITTTRQRTLPVALAVADRRVLHQLGPLSAGTVLATVPIVICFIFLQRNLTGVISRSPEGMSAWERQADGTAAGPRSLRAAGRGRPRAARATVSTAAAAPIRGRLRRPRRRRMAPAVPAPDAVEIAGESLTLDWADGDPRRARRLRRPLRSANSPASAGAEAAVARARGGGGRALLRPRRALRPPRPARPGGRALGAERGERHGPYKPVPFVLSSRGHAVALQGTRRMHASARPSRDTVPAAFWSRVAAARGIS